MWRPIQALFGTMCVKHHQEVHEEVLAPEAYATLRNSPPEVCFHQWCQERLTLWNARSQTEGDDLGISVLSVGLVNESLPAKSRGRRNICVGHGLVFMSRWCPSCKISRAHPFHWAQHVEPIRGQQSLTRDVLLVLLDWVRSSMRHVLREIPSIKLCVLRYRTSGLRRGVELAT